MLIFYNVNLFKKYEQYEKKVHQQNRFIFDFTSGYRILSKSMHWVKISKYTYVSCARLKERRFSHGKGWASVAHILLRHRVPHLGHLNKPSKSHSTTLEPISYERSRQYLLNVVNRVSKFEFWPIFDSEFFFQFSIMLEIQ